MLANLLEFGRWYIETGRESTDNGFVMFAVPAILAFAGLLAACS